MKNVQTVLARLIPGYKKVSVSIDGKIFLLILAIFGMLSACQKDFEKTATAPAVDFHGSQRLSKPNIILIIGDDVGYEIPAYSGGESYSTPHLDFLSENGIEFSNFFSHPDGPPSRLALMTGKYNYRNWDGFGFLSPDAKTFANMLHNGGYKTCFVGKWQFDGGDTSIKNHGFDQYLVFMPFNPTNNNGHNQFYRRYKNPYLYKSGHYLPDSTVKGKYSEDMFFHYAGNFIDSNRNSPFLLVYSHNLVQKPWVPTPDDPDFQAWDPATDDVARTDRKYFPAMVAYMDKIIGKLIDKVNNAGIADITYILFVSDNATNKSIRSKYKGQWVKGAKDSTTKDGLNVPFLVYRQGNPVNGKIDTSLVDMTDFLPSFAGIAGIPVPTTWGPLDGTTFYDNLTGDLTQQRSTIYCYWPSYFKRYTAKSFVFDYNYKLYDSLNGNLFYNIRMDTYEQHPIPYSQLTPYERQLRHTFRKILDDAFSQMNQSP